MLTWFIADSLCAKFIRAKDGVADTQPAFAQLTDCLDPSLINEWTRQEQVAMEKRGEHLAIYDVKSTKCRTICNSTAEHGSLIVGSTHTCRNPIENGGNGGSAGEPFRISVYAY